MNYRNFVIQLSVVSLFCLSAAAAATIDFGTDLVNPAQAGTFTSDNDVQVFSFALSQASTVSFTTTSWAGANGFAPNLTLFYGDGSTSGVSVGDNADVTLTADLFAGSYWLALNESPNIALGKLSDGFEFDPAGSGNPCPTATNNFTGSACLGYGPSDTAFWDSANAQHSGNWALSAVALPDEPSQVPEPSTILLSAIGISAAAYLRRRP